MGKSRRLRKAAVVVCVLAGLAYPIETRLSPRWRVQVVAAGSPPRPLSGCQVTQSWQHYTFQNEGAAQTKHTDAEGWVEFPARSVSASLLGRMIGAVWNLRDGVHSSFGPAVDLVVSCRGYETGFIKYGGEGPPAGMIIVQKRPQ